MKKMEIYDQDGKLNTGKYLGLMAVAGAIVGVTVQLGASAVEGIRNKYREHKYREHKFKKLAKQMESNLEALQDNIKESE